MLYINSSVTLREHSRHPSGCSGAEQDGGAGRREGRAHNVIMIIIIIIIIIIMIIQIMKIANIYCYCYHDHYIINVIYNTIA